MQAISTQRKTKISFFRPGQLARPDHLEDLTDIYELIRTGFRVETEYIQKKYRDTILNDFPDGKTSYQGDKKRLLPSVCFAGNIDRSSGAKNDDFIHSGRICLDIDDNSKQELDDFFDLVRSGRLQYVEAAARSVSGAVNGSLWVNVKIEIPSNIDRLDRGLTKLLTIQKTDDHFTKFSKLHEGYHRALTYLFADQVKIKVGTSKDLKRGRYLTHDADLYLNRSAKDFRLKTLLLALKKIEAEEAKLKKQVDHFDRQTFDIEEQDAFKFAEAFAAKEYSYENRQLYISRLAIGLNLLGIPQDAAEAYVNDRYPDYDFRRRDGISFPYKKYSDSFGRWSYKLKPKEVKSDLVFSLKPGQYLSDYADQLSDIIHTNGKVDLKSGTGTGKNFAVVRHIAPALKKLNGCKTVVVCSLNAKTEKDAEQYKLEFITGERLKKSGFLKSHVWQEAVKADVLLCNQDSFPKIAEHFDRQGEQLNVFLDESQTLVNGMSYRPEVIVNLMTAAKRIAKTICLMSGTPKPYFSKLGFKRIEVNQDDRPAILTTVRHRLKSLELTALKHCQMTAFDQVRTVIKLQSKNGIRRTKALLLASGFKADEVVCLFSEKSIKESKAYQKFKEAKQGQESFAAVVKVVLCTSFINEGLDIYSDYDLQFVNIEKRRSFDIEELIQFADRHRTGKNKQLISYHPQDDDQDADRIDINFNALAYFEEQLQHWQQEADQLNDERDRLQDLTSEPVIFDLKTKYSENEKYLYWQEEEGQISCKVNHLALMKLCDDLKTRRTKTTAGFAEIAKNYPYFKIKDERQQLSDPSADDQEQLDQLKQDERQVKLDIHDQLATLYDNDRNILFQAVGMLTDDLKLKNLVEYQADRKDAVNRLISSFPDVFDDYFSEAEQLVRTHFKLADQLLPEDDVRKLIFETDQDTGKTKLTSSQRLSIFLTGFKIHLSLLLYSLTADLSKTQLKALTIQQLKDAKQMTAVIEAIEDQSERYDHRLTPLQIFRTVKQAYGRMKAADLTQNKAVSLVNVLFESNRITGAEAVYQIGSCRHFSDYLKDYEIDGEKFTQNLCKKLKISKLIRQT